MEVKEKALDHTVCRIRFERDYGLVVSQARWWWWWWWWWWYINWF